MNYSIDISSALSAAPAEAAPPAAAVPAEAVDLLRQILEVQREQLVCARAAAAAHDAGARWRAFLSRWQKDFPDLSEGCRKAVPLLERSYAYLIHELTTATLRLSEDGQDLENDFSLQEFLDRFGMRLAQLGTIINLVAPLAEVAPPGEPA
jgi:hypothetical protein